jgi:hypothetical protein
MNWLLDDHVGKPVSPDRSTTDHCCVSKSKILIPVMPVYNPAMKRPLGDHRGDHTPCDLTEIPDIPSIFERGLRESLDFLHKFASDVSRPFTPDTETHVEYAPTQVVSEYLRHRFRGKGKNPVQGVVYSSAKSKGTKNIVLFVGAHEVVGYKSSSRVKPKPLLKLIKARERFRRKKSHGKSH